jgi:hypothetical protein
MSTSPVQRQPRCFYCDSILEDDQARISLPGGKIFGPCCADIVVPRNADGEK